jgi:hypothetical protein
MAANEGGKPLISFAYFYNSGYAELIYSSSKNSCVGEEYILNYLKKGFSPQEIKKDYLDGKIGFNVKERFYESLKEMERREMACDLKMGKFIRENYQNTKLFATNNHPHKIVFEQYLRQLEYLGFLKPKKPYNSSSETNLSTVPAPITPMCKEALGYKFAYDDNWKQLGIKLIDIVISNFMKAKNI